MPRVHREHLVLTGLCTAVTALFLLLWLVPAIQEHHRLFRAIPPAQQQIEDFRQAVSLLATLRASRDELPDGGPGAHEEVPVEQVAPLLDRLAAMAREAGLEVHGTETEVLAPADAKNEHLAAVLHLSGPAPACRALVHRLHTLPEIAAITQVRLEAAAPDAVRMTIHLRIDLAP